jgi:hypothetical protein
VVADAAYPAHCASGIETVTAGDDHLAVLGTVLDRLDACGHVSAAIHTDLELSTVAEEDAPGVSAYRKELDRMVRGRVRLSTAHDQILARLDEAARRFRVFIIKTPLQIPYTSVFIELGCGYWTLEAERRLRASINERGCQDDNVG